MQTVIIIPANYLMAVVIYSTTVHSAVNWYMFELDGQGLEHTAPN
jgi:hypothetical protein